VYAVDAGDGIVDDLALERRHCLHRHRLTRGDDVGRGRSRQLDQGRPAALAVTAYVEHQPAALAGLSHHGQPGQLLQRVEDLAPAADQVVQLLAHDGNDGTGSFDVHVDVTVEVDDVQQALEVVSGNLALLLQQGQVGHLAVRRVLGAHGFQGVGLGGLRLVRGLGRPGSVGGRRHGCSSC